MKTRLGLLWGKRRLFEAEFARYGTRPSYRRADPEPIPTLLLKNVCLKNGGERVADHVWVRDLTPFLEARVNPNPGERVCFKGRVDSFPKGSYEVDFHIVDLEKVKLHNKRNARA